MEKRPDIVRLKVNINRETAEVLTAFADGTDGGVTEVIRRAVSLLKFVEDQRAAGRKLMTTDHNGKDKWEVVLVE